MTVRLRPFRLIGATLGVMGPETHPKLPLDEIHARIGIEVTEEGKARARRRLDEAKARLDPAALDALRARLRLGPAGLA